MECKRERDGKVGNIKGRRLVYSSLLLFFFFIFFYFALSVQNVSHSTSGAHYRGGGGEQKGEREDGSRMREEEPRVCDAALSIRRAD